MPAVVNSAALLCLRKIVGGNQIIVVKPHISKLFFNLTTHFVPGWLFCLHNF